MANNCKHYKQQRQISWDSGQTWSNVSPAQYQVGDLYQTDSPDCIDPGLIRWAVVPGDYICDGKDKYVKEIEQYTIDNGTSWMNVYPATYRKGSLIERNSNVCNNKWEGHYVEEWHIPSGVCPRWYKWVEGIGCVYVDPIKFVRCSTSSSTTLTSGDTTYSPYLLHYGTIGGCVTEIGENAFKGYNVMSGVTMLEPDNITSIGDNAFSGCSNLSSFDIPVNVTTIGQGAFAGCSEITTIDIPDSVISLGNGAFHFCTSLSSVTIGSGVTSIGTSSFYWCNSLTGITIPNTVTSIGYNAFEGCTSLTSIDIPDSITTLGDESFKECTSLTSCTMGSGITSIGDSTFMYCSGLTTIEIPSSIRSIDDWAFRYCSGLTSVTVNALTPPTLGTRVFSGTNDCTIYVPCESVNLYKAASGWSNYASRITGIPPCGTPPTDVYKLKMTYPGGSEYKLECDSATTLTTGDTKPSGYEYSAMTSAVIGDCITSISDWTFYNCTSLSSITIPGSVTTIGYASFSNCSGLTNVNIPNSVTSIGDYAFRACTGLTSATIGNGVTSIAQLAFFNCWSLTEITIKAIAPPTLGYNIFQNTSNDLVIYVPSGSVDTYKAASGWSDYASRIQAIPT